MNIPSPQKIEKQASAYAKATGLILTNDEKAEYAALNKARPAMHDRIDAARGGCPGGSRCRCATNPAVKALEPEIQANSSRVNSLWQKQADAEKAVYREWHYALSVARQAKLKLTTTKKGTEYK